MTFLNRLIMHILPAVLLALLAVSCIHPDNDRDESFSLNSLTVQGKILDSDDHATLSGIRIDITAYETKDPEKTTPVMIQALRSNFDGSYSLILTNTDEKPLSGAVFYEFRVYDESGTFRTVVRDLYLSSSSPCYSATSRSYRVLDNDFYLNR